MATVLGQSGNILKVLGGGGQIYDVAQDQVSPEFISGMQQVPALSLTGTPGAPPMPVPDALLGAPQAQEMLAFNPQGDIPDNNFVPDSSANTGLSLVTPQAQGDQRQVEGMDMMQARSPSQLVGANPAPQMQGMPGFGSAPSSEGFDQMEAGAKNAMQAGQQAAAAQVGYADQMQRSMAQRQAESLKQQEELQSSIGKEVDVLNQMGRDFNALGSVDPGRLWNDSSTGAKIGASLSIALGALGGALQGTNQNLALGTINKLIDRDIEAQRMALDKKKGALGVQQGIVGNLRQQFGDNQMADAAAHKIYYDQAELQLKKMMAAASSKEAQARGEMMLGQIQNQRAAYDMQFRQMAAKNYAMGAVAGGGEVASPMMLPKEMQERAVRVGDKYRVAVSDTAAKEVNSKLPALDDMTRIANEIKGVSGVASTIPGTQKKAKAESLVSQLAFSMKNAEGLGVLSDKEREWLVDIAGNPTSVFTSNTAARLNELLTSIDFKKKRLLEQNIINYKAPGLEQRSIKEKPR